MNDKRIERARKLAADTEATLPPETLARLRACHDQHFAEREDGGRRYELTDILFWLASAGTRGLTLADVAALGRCPVSYLETVSQLADLPARCGRVRLPSPVAT
jgi:hypothetical protein